LAQWQPLYYQASTPEETLSVIAHAPLEWGVGEERHYSDLGFMVLGFLVEAVSQRPLDQFLEDEVYGPLGLSHTGFEPATGPFAATSHGNPYEYRMVHDTAFGYRYRGDADAWKGWRTHTLVGEVNDGNAHHALGGVAGHAGLFSTAHDLQVLLQLLLDGGQTSRGRRLLPESTVRQFLTPQFPGQALGWQIPEWSPPGSFAHTGFTGTFVMGNADRGLAVILLTNRQNFGVDQRTRYPDLGPLQREVVEAILGGE
jgi:CubicO group peptidase (beta-lactamase class C family)